MYNEAMTHLLRVNLDTGGEKSLRFKNALETIKSISKVSNKVIIMSHRGRPRGQQAKLSLRIFVKPLSAGLRKKVAFLENFDFEKIARRVDRSPGGSVFLLENLRFLPGELRADGDLARSLASLGDRFINDDFPTSHRKNASNFMLPKLLPSVLGPNFKRELGKLRKVMEHSRRPLVLVVGGAKTSDKLGVVKNFLGRADSILLGGGPANTMLLARGVRIGKSLYGKDALGKMKDLARKEKIVTPVDWEVKGGAILDIGKATVELYIKALKGARTIIWNGPMGKFEEKPFDRGTKALYRAIFAQKGANILIGGGDTLAAIALPRTLGKNVFVSSGGGAMLTYLSGEKLPALEAVE